MDFGAEHDQILRYLQMANGKPEVLKQNPALDEHLVELTDGRLARFQRLSELYAEAMGS
jgi:hypothetical protein